MWKTPLRGQETGQPTGDALYHLWHGVITWPVSRDCSPCGDGILVLPQMWSYAAEEVPAADDEDSMHESGMSHEMGCGADVPGLSAWSAPATEGCDAGAGAVASWDEGSDRSRGAGLVTRPTAALPAALGCHFGTAQESSLKTCRLSTSVELARTYKAHLTRLIPSA